MSILRRIGILDAALLLKDRFADAHQMDLIYRAIPGLYEWLWDEAPPGGGSQVVIGEDHTGPTLAGGVEIPRNCIVSAGFGSGSRMMWELTNLTNAAGWLPADYAHTNARSTSLGYQFPGYASPGMDTATHSSLFAEGWVALYVPESGGTLVVRITNATTATSSATTTITRSGTIQHVKIDEIPLAPDQKNQFLLEYYNPGDVESITVRTYEVNIAEVYLSGALNVSPHSAPLSQPPLTGSTP